MICSARRAKERHRHRYLEVWGGVGVSREGEQIMDCITRTATKIENHFRVKTTRSLHPNDRKSWERRNRTRFR